MRLVWSQKGGWASLAAYLLQALAHRLSNRRQRDRVSPPQVDLYHTVHLKDDLLFVPAGSLLLEHTTSLVAGGVVASFVQSARLAPPTSNPWSPCTRGRPRARQCRQWLADMLHAAANALKVVDAAGGAKEAPTQSSGTEALAPQALDVDAGGGAEEAPM